MKIAGLQRLTLLDYPGKVAALIFTAGCNLRCPFCHNGSLVLPQTAGESISEEDVLAFLSKRCGILEGVAVTGGEPLLHLDLPAFLSKVKAMGYSVKLDTNGTNPDLLADLVSEGIVDYVAMDIKNAPNTYKRAVGCEDFSLSAIEKTKAFLLCSHVEYEFRTTLVKGIHTESDVLAMAEWIKGAKAYYLQSYTASSAVLAPEGLSSFSNEELSHFLTLVKTHVPNAKIRGF